MRLRLVVAVMAMLAADLSAHADTFQLNFSGSGETGSVLLTGSATAVSGEFLVTAATGLIDNLSVSLLPPNTYPSIGPNDNFLFFPLTAGQASFDVNGISFLLAGGTDYNVYNQASQYFATIGQQRSVSNITSLAVTRASAVTPEPASFLLLGTGLLSVTGIVRRRFASAR